jgi:hypothetical protein
VGLRERQAGLISGSTMAHPLAGKPAPASMLVDVGRLTDAYFTQRIDLDDPNQLVSFGYILKILSALTG